jgi:chemotaxis protein MotB
MKQFLNVVFICFSSMLLVSCGASKKLETANAENARLQSVVADQTGQLSAKDKALSSKDQEITRLKKENALSAKEAADCRELKDAINQKIDNLNKNLAANGTSVQEIREHIAAAEKKFEDIGAVVTYKNGMIHVMLPDGMFFKPGSSAIGTRGRESLNIVADVMRKYSGVQTIIVGNTDNTEPKKGADNWSISTERANAVVRVLTESYYVNPARLTAAGRSKYSPVAENNTEAGRARNRRIEIIFNPDMSRLWDMIDK